jgi:hypothetical protein
MPESKNMQRKCLQSADHKLNRDSCGDWSSASGHLVLIKLGKLWKLDKPARQDRTIRNVDDIVFRDIIFWVTYSLRDTIVLRRAKRETLSTLM